jgi:hypothetical protein
MFNPGGYGEHEGMLQCYISNFTFYRIGASNINYKKRYRNVNMVKGGNQEGKSDKRARYGTRGMAKGSTALCTYLAHKTQETLTQR